jgi:heptosyltransferase-2
VGERILVVHLEALGAVLRSTSLLAAIHRKYPGAHVTWVTKAPAQHLLQGLPQIDRILTLSADDLLKLRALEFDVALMIDKSLPACGVLAHTKARKVYGFVADRAGAIVPANFAAEELWELGLSDHKKFFVNQKSEQHLVHEALALGPYTRDEYQIALTLSERELARSRRGQWQAGRRPIIGINTGCSPALPHKKLSVDGHRRLIQEIRSHEGLKDCRIVLLGGPEDTERNALIGNGLAVIQSPTEKGLRDGLASVEACDLVFTGDSLGMHMAIGLHKWVVAWFGPSCAQEIELYGRGEKILTKAPCSPCWKRVCEKPVMCYDQIDFSQAVVATAKGLNWLTSSSKPHSLATSFSPSL